MIFDKVYRTFFHYEDFLHWAYKPNLQAIFLLVLEIELKRDCTSAMKAMTLMWTMIGLTCYIKMLTSMHYHQKQKFLQSNGFCGICNTHLPIYPNRKVSRTPTLSNGLQMSKLQWLNPHLQWTPTMMKKKKTSTQQTLMTFPKAHLTTGTYIWVSNPRRTDG